MEILISTRSVVQLSKVSRLKRDVLSHVFFLVVSCFCTEMAAETDLKQFAAAIHVHSTFSNGQYEVMELARLAKERNIDVLVLTDSFLTSITYGIWPLDRIGFEGINKVVRLGVRDYGVKNYLAAVEEAQREFPDLVIVPGVEVTPYYYWEGKPWTGLTLYDFDRHFTVLGLTKEQIENLPVIGNATWENTPKDWTLSAAPLLMFFASVGLLLVKRRRKIQLQYYTIYRHERRWIFGTVLMLSALLLAWNNYPFGRLSNPYLGGHDVRAYQRLIDYVLDKGGVIYWSYPEARYADVEVGGARMVSRPHPEDLLLTDGYHGFEGIYGDRITATLPGEAWDLALVRYLNGSRSTPPYVITGIDFHYLKDNRGRWYDLDGGQTILLASEKSEAAVLEALRGGHGYATFQELDEKLRLHDFSVETDDGARTIQGGEAEGQSPVRVHIHLDWLREAPEKNQAFQLALISNGEVVQQIEQPLPIRITLEQQLPSGPHYFRLRAVYERVYQVLSNPVFVRIIKPANAPG
ncbi:hypothetical protein MYX65_01740 [Acidobacteria bacterium AH-259-L09]|nr:hypothetical protein [Acidobacteria bacterium AH-259-L09]